MNTELTPSQARMLAALRKWMEEFFCNSSERDDSLVFALDNGWILHAASVMDGTGATDKRFDRIYCALVRSVGRERFEKLNRKEISELLKFARLQKCPECNHHSFTDPHDDPVSICPSCLFRYESTESEVEDAS